MVGGAVFFAAGVRLWKFALGLGGIALIAPIVYDNLKDYQRSRITTFLDPESDPLGAGYNIIQSKIALGSGGMWGKGFLQGTQGHLNFLPEKQTDFIFTMLAEEFGLVGGLTVLGLLALVIAFGFIVALRSRHQFGRLVAVGLATNYFGNPMRDSVVAQCEYLPALAGDYQGKIADMVCEVLDLLTDDEPMLKRDIDDAFQAMASSDGLTREMTFLAKYGSASLCFPLPSS
jgi:hypothetical protein